MIQEQFSRTGRLIGEEGMDLLRKSRVAVFGIGGVGGHAVEALARSGIGKLDLIDNDVIVPSNLNRQLIATYKTIGMRKVDAMKERILEIVPDCSVLTYPCFYLPETAEEFDLSQYDYVIDAVDTVTAKLELVMRAQQAGTRIISSMGAGNKLDPTAFEVADIYETSVCPLARVMRRELKKRGIKSLKVVYSKEEALTPFTSGVQEEKSLNGKKRETPGSVAFVPSVAGMILAGEVIKDLLHEKKQPK